jgi:hypothetical protein
LRRAWFGVLVALIFAVAPVHAASPAEPGVTVRAVALDVAPDATTPVEPPAAAQARGVSGGYWPWWLGAVALGWLTVGFWALLGLPLGVSNSWEKITTWRAEHARRTQEAVLADADADRIRAALLAETLEQFGPEALKQVAIAPAVATERNPPRPRPPVSAHVTFLVMIGVGGSVAAMLNGDVQWRFDLGDTHRALFGDGAWMWIALFLGGFMAGFGSRLGGGCTSGHGLSGLSRLQAGSIVGTATFFGAAILVSLLLRWWSQ